MLFKLLIILVSVFALGCESGAVKETVTKAPDSKLERIAILTRIIKRNNPLPSAILDAKYIHIQKGDRSTI